LTSSFNSYGSDLFADIGIWLFASCERLFVSLSIGIAQETGRKGCGIPLPQGQLKIVDLFF